MRIVKIILYLALLPGCSDFDLSEDRRSGEFHTIDAAGNAVLEDVRTGKQRPAPDTIDIRLEQANKGNIAPLLIVVLSLAASGCMTFIRNDGEGYKVRVDSGTKANATAQITGYSRGGIQDGHASTETGTEDENWTDSEGGGEVNGQADVSTGPGL